MKPFKKLLGRLNGLHYKQEYLCLAAGAFEQPLHAYLTTNGRVIKDITNHHAFVGYYPLLFSFFTPGTDEIFTETITIVFAIKSLSPNEVFAAKDAIAELTLKKINQQAAGDGHIVYYEGHKGRHHFVSGWHQFIIGLYNKLYQKKPGNVFLPGNLQKQVQIAYSIPRNISLITAGENNRFNLFPTDLHGPAGPDHYIISLRYEGKACQQVLQTGKLLLSQVESDAYKIVYMLGKNHMQKMKEKENFPFSNDLSAGFQLPVPEHALRYRELELADGFKHGIHHLLLFKVNAFNQLSKEPGALSHIHSVYGTWRHNKGLAGNYLLR
jgi:flavin reductase (DIM6/NTAB) family NADH-FMN oxidoreductase RutF